MTKTLAPATPTRVVNLTTMIRPLFAPATAPLVPMHRNTTTLKLARSLPKQPAQLQRLKSKKFPVTRVAGSMSRAAGTGDVQPIGREDLNLPLGVSRFVTVATLRVMLKANRSDLVLQKNGPTWDICEDTMQIDLTDDTKEYRVGSVQVYS